jgi:ligand-binding sensor domain-containing protein
LLINIFIVSIQLSAENKPILFKTLSVDDGLSQAIMQDKNSKMWIGTLVGLSRYNIETDNFTNYL